MNYLKELLPNEILRHKPSINQFNLVCNISIHKTCIYNSKFITALISLVHNSLTGKRNAFLLKVVNTKKISKAIKNYTSNKPNSILLTKIDFENKELSIQKYSYLRIGQELL